MEKIRIDIPREHLILFCKKWKIKEFSVFGSALRDDFRPDSDVDILVEFAEDAHWGLFDLGRMEDELKEMLGRKIDLITRRSVEESQNYLRRRHILASLETIHVAR